MRAIVLAAGEGYQVGGFNKILLRRPDSGETIMDQYMRLFHGLDITVVVGYRAVNIMNLYPDLNYVYNADWQFTQDSRSLSLALSDEPCYVVQTDLFIMDDVLGLLSEDDGILAAHKENRSRTDVNVRVEDGRIANIYPGELRRPDDVQPLDIYKVCDRHLLRIWKRNCRENPHIYSVLNLPIEEHRPIHAAVTAESSVIQIKTPLDYANFLRRCVPKGDSRT